jgi:hypothetical protein
VSARIVVLCLAATFAISTAADARAVVVLITQAKAMAGDVTPGDAPGFPVSITRPGSYRLTTNLRTSSGPAVEIVADNVSLNLNGFSIIGSNVWPSGEAIVGDDRKYIRIHLRWRAVERMAAAGGRHHGESGGGGRVPSGRLPVRHRRS